MEEKADRIVRSVCQTCHCECGVLVHVKGAKVTKIEGDPDHPQNDGHLCPKALAFTQVLYHPDRLKHPLKRAGARGEGRWLRISWEEALDTIASRFKETLNKYGPLSVGWNWGDGERGNIICNLALLAAMGSPNSIHSDGHYCLQPALIAERLTYGSFITWEWGPDYKNSKCILLWGANPVACHPARAKDIIRGMDENGAKLIVVDPRFIDMAAKADVWLQVRPGSDDALALGMINYLIENRLYHADFVENWCYGFAELKKRAREYPLNRVAEITWVPEEEIRRAAHTYATCRPGALHLRLGTNMTSNCIQTIRALAILMALTGNIDVKGGNLIPTPWRSPLSMFDQMKMLQQPEEVINQRAGANEFPLYAGAQSLGMSDAHAPLAYKSMLAGEGSPIKAMMVVNDPLMGLEGGKQVHQALSNLEFLVATDFFLSPTARHADIVLPAATWVEKDELHELHYMGFIAAGVKAIDPVGECRDEKEIAAGLIKRLGYKPPIPLSSVEEYNNFRLSPLGISFAELKEKGHVRLGKMEYRKYEKTGFATHTGKVELYSTELEKYGHDPLPYYKENPESPLSSPELYKDYPFILISGGRKICFHDSAHRQIPWLREMCPDPVVEIHPDTADQLDIKDGDWVWIETPQGRIKQRAELTLGIHPKVVHAASHWWYPESPKPDGNWQESNINAIMPLTPTEYDPICGAYPSRGSLCKVYKADI